MYSKHYKIKVILTLLLSCILITAQNAAAADFAVILKSGVAKLSDDTQFLDGQVRTFDDESNKTLGIAWEIRNSRNVGMGMEYITFEHDFISPSSTGYAKTELYLFSARKYFAPESMVHPFCGIGLGWGYTKFSHIADTDRNWDYALQISAGLELQLAEEFGIYIEAKGLASGTDGERENEFDYSGSGLMAGVSFIF